MNLAYSFLRTIFPALLAVIGGSACDAVVGSESDADADASTAELTMCEQAAEILCTQACDCQPTERCFTVYGDGVATAEYDDFDHCRSFTSFTCASSEESQLQSCIDSLAVPICVSETHDGEAVEALPVPMECVDANI